MTLPPFGAAPPLDEAHPVPSASPVGRRFRWPAMATVYAAALALLGWSAGLVRIDDNSFLWHLRTGAWILDHHTVPRGDLYSYTVPGHPWVVQSWLAELLYGLTDRTVGPSGIRILTAALCAAIGYSAFRLAHRIVGRRIIAAGVAFAALLASAELWNPRPLLLGLCAFVLLLWIVEVPDWVGGRHPLIAIPVVLWFWANVHGSFALGFAYLLLHLVGSWLDGRPPWRGRERRIGQGALIGLAACFVNPYGPGLVLFPVELLRRGEILHRIAEWQSPDFRSPVGITLALWTVVLIVALARAGRRASWRDLLVAVTFLLLALWAQRNALLAPLAGLPVVARALSTLDAASTPVGVGAGDSVGARAAEPVAGRPAGALAGRPAGTLAGQGALGAAGPAGGGVAGQGALGAAGPAGGGVAGLFGAGVVERAERGRINLALLALIVLLGGGVAAKKLSEPAFDLHTYPVGAMRAVEANGLLGRRLLTTDAWAGYVIKTYWPRQRVFIDDRYDMYPTALAEEYFLLGRGDPGWSNALSENRIDVVVWGPKAPLPQYLGLVPGWTRIYQDKVAVVFARVPPPS